MHPFEESGLGRPPYRLIRLKICDPMTRCDYCGTRVRRRFICKSADAKQFGVGCDCIAKVERPGSALRMEVEEAEKARQAAELAERVKRAKDVLARNTKLLRNTKHPMRPGETMRDYVEYVFEHGGAKKRAYVCKIVEDALTKGTKRK